MTRDSQEEPPSSGASSERLEEANASMALGSRSDANPSTPVDSTAAKPKPSSFRHLEIVTKLVIVVAASAYFGGYLVVNLHLARHGIHSIGFFDKQYTLAGLWALFPPLVGMLAASLLIYVVLNERGVGLVIALVVALAGLWLELWTLGLIGSPKTWLLCAFVGFSLTALIQVQTRELLARLHILKANVTELIPTANAFVFLLLFSPAYFYNFSRHAYPNIPQNLGGGAQVLARLAVSESGRAALQQIGVEFAGDSRVSNELNLLMMTDSELMIELPNSRVSAVLKRDIVEGVLFKTP